jgi:hypothetical protein
VPLSRKKLIVVAMERDRVVLHYAHRPYTRTRLWVYFNRPGYLGAIRRLA